MAVSAGIVCMSDDGDMEAQRLLDEPTPRSASRHSLSRVGIAAALAVAAALGCAACAHAGARMSEASTRGLGVKVEGTPFDASKVARPSTTEERAVAASHLLESVALATGLLVNDTDERVEQTALGAQALSGIVGVLEEESDPNGTVHVRSGVWNLQNMSNVSDGAKAGQQLLKNVLESTGVVSGGKAPGLHATAGALGDLLGVLDNVGSKEGSTAVDEELANLGSPFAKDGEGFGEGDSEAASAALGAWTGALAKAADAADQAGNRDAAGKDTDPFAALDAFAGAMAEQGRKGQKGDLSGKDANPFATMGGLAGAMAGVLEEEIDPNGTVHVRNGVNSQNMSNVRDGEKAVQQLLKDALGSTGAAGVGKAPDLHATVGALGDLLGVLDGVGSKQGSTAFDEDLANLGNPFSKDGDGFGEGKLEGPSAALDAWTGALAKATDAAEKAGSADAVGKDADPFAALDAFAGAMAKQDRQGQNAALSDKDANPFAALGGLAGAMAGTTAEQVAKVHKGSKLGTPVTEEAAPKAF